MDHAAKGKSALSSGDSNSAISHYTHAISSNPQAPDYYIQRSTAYTRQSPPDHQAALRDAEIAVVLANKRATRELIASSQLRRAIALYGAERYADAKQCLQWVKKLNEKEKTLGIWEMKADGRLKELEEGDRRAKVTVKQTPDIEIPKPLESGKSKIMNTTSATNTASHAENEKSKPRNGTSDTSTASGPVQTPVHKIRSDWYQSSDSVTVTLLAKGVPEKQAVVKIGETLVEMNFPLTTGSDYDFTLDPLYSKIDPDASSFKVMPTKVEFKLKKATPGLKWASLEGIPPQTSNEESTSDVASAVRPSPDLHTDKPRNSGPAYPTSSKSGPKNWDKLADDLTKRAKKKEGEEGEDEGDGGGFEDEDGGDPVNGFFKKLFKDADPDTKRAMMKSYQESNGTALSTNWAEVGKKTVETSPPDGMEAKKWGS